MKTTYQLLLSTFQRLLRVTLDGHFGLLGVDLVDDGHGIYFGLTSNEERIFAVTRNLDIFRKVSDPAQPTNAIMELSLTGTARTGRIWTQPEFDDLHQIRWHDGLLWLVTGRAPELVAADPESRRLVGAVTLSDLVPASLRHDPPSPEHGDRYHFNSLTFSGGRLWVLAHNWVRGSFALELDYQGPRRLLDRPVLIQTHLGLGHQSHDVFHDGARLYVLDGEGGRLLVTGRDPVHLATAASDRATVFPRGLAIGSEYLFAGCGRFATERSQRSGGPSRIAVLERATFRRLAEVELGDHGNPCDLLLLSEADWSDHPKANAGRPIALAAPWNRV